jgi:hypothetical protein
VLSSGGGLPIEITLVFVWLDGVRFLPGSWGGAYEEFARRHGGDGISKLDVDVLAAAATSLSLWWLWSLAVVVFLHLFFFFSDAGKSKLEN